MCGIGEDAKASIVVVWLKSDGKAAHEHLGQETKVVVGDMTAREGDRFRLHRVGGDVRRFEDAVKTARKALDLAVATGENATAENIREHLKSYEAGRPWRE